MKTIFAIIFLFGMTSSLQAEKFNSPFLNFNTPPGWSCTHIAGSWNCNSPKNSPRKGIIVLTTKKTKVGVNLKTYLNRLQKPMKTEWNSQTIESQPQSVEEVTIRNHNWIQATHLNSEIPNGVTKYLITIKNGLTILVSFTASNDDYPSFSSAFVKSIESLKINPKLSQMNAPKNLVKTNINNQLKVSNELDDLFTDESLGAPESKMDGRLDNTKKLGILALLVLAAIFFIISKKRKR